MWTPKASASTPRSNAGAGVINGKLYVVGGCLNSDCTTSALGTLEVYDPSHDSWTPDASMATARAQAAVAAVGGKLYAAGGFSESGTLTSVEVYDSTLNTWSPAASMPAPRSGAIASVVNGIIYVIGGFDGSSAVNTVLAYDPVADTWATKVGAMTTARAHAAAG